MERHRQPRDLLRGRRAQHVDELARLLLRGVRPGRDDHASTSSRARSGCRRCRCGCSALHAWAIVAPQVVEGMASVLVLYRVVRRLAGPLAGIVAAGRARAVARRPCALNRGQRPRHADGPAAAAGGRRDRQRDHLRAAAQPDLGRGAGRPGLPGEDDRGLAGAAGARARLSGRRARPAGPARSRGSVAPGSWSPPCR